MLALAAIEQVNLSQRTILSRNFERQHLAAVADHPRKCRSFYAAPERDRAPYEVQVNAIMIAQAQHLRTINGYSGLLPPGWDFYDTNAADYEQRALRWAAKRGVTQNLCRVNVESGTWTFALEHDLSCASRGCPISFGASHEFTINLAQGGNGALFADDGHWAGPEPWGQWTAAQQATLSFLVGAPRDLGFALTVRGLLSAKAPKQSTWVEANRCRIGGIELDLAHDAEPQTISGVIPASCVDADGRIVLRINTDRLRSPKEIGINDDARKLGVGVERVVIRESNIAGRQ